MGQRILETGLVFFTPKGETATAPVGAEAIGDALWIGDRSGAPANSTVLLDHVRQVLVAAGRPRYRSYSLRFAAELHDAHPHPIAARIAKATINSAALQAALGQEVMAAEVVLTSFDEQARRYTLVLAPQSGSLGTHLLRAELTVHVEEPLEVPRDLPTLRDALEAGHPRLARWTRAAVGLNEE